MFEVTVQRRFNALHAIVVGGHREPLHGHDWLVEATIAGPALDGEGLLCDFHAVEAALEGVVAPWAHTDLNASVAFGGANLEPTAENVAFVVAGELARALAGRLPAGARVACVRVTEAPHCVAAYRPTDARAPGP